MSEKIDKAMSLFKERKYKEAIDAFSLVLETEPDNADVYNNMGVAILVFKILNTLKIIL